MSFAIDIPMRLADLPSPLPRLNTPSGREDEGSVGIPPLFSVDFASVAEDRYHMILCLGAGMMAAVVPVRAGKWAAAHQTDFEPSRLEAQSRWLTAIPATTDTGQRGYCGYVFRDVTGHPYLALLAVKAHAESVILTLTSENGLSVSVVPLAAIAMLEAAEEVADEHALSEMSDEDREIECSLAELKAELLG